MFSDWFDLKLTWDAHFLLFAKFFMWDCAQSGINFILITERLILWLLWQSHLFFLHNYHIYSLIKFPKRILHRFENAWNRSASIEPLDSPSVWWKYWTCHSVHHLLQWQKSRETPLFLCRWGILFFWQIILSLIGSCWYIIDLSIRIWFSFIFMCNVIHLTS